MRIRNWGALTVALAVAACAGNEDRRIPDRVDPRVEVEPGTPVERTPVGAVEECEVDQLSGPAVYGHKVKNLLTGKPLSAAELAQLRQDPATLRSLVQAWKTTPEFRAVMLRFFQTAFQQNQPDVDGLTTMLRRNALNWGVYADPREPVAELMLAAIEESFARTALRIMEEGRPWTDVVTTDRFEMTTALLVLHGLLEARWTSDDDRLVIRPDPTLDEIVLHSTPEAAPPPEEALNPRSRNFLHFYVEGFDGLCLEDGATTFTAQPRDLQTRDIAMFVFTRMVGRPDRVINRAVNNRCRTENDRVPPLLSREDFQDWRTVQFRRPLTVLDDPTPFYDLPSLREATVMLTDTERVGFFTSLGFFTTWPTNVDNASRVTLNQTLITALGHSFDGTTVSDFAPPNLDAEHSAPGTACYGCHQTLDPMRDFFRSSYSFAYGVQDDPERLDAMEPIFVFRGVRETGAGVTDLSRILAEHPDFPAAWVQKLCHFANGAACPEDSEAFGGVVERFVASNLNFDQLLEDLMTSPLVTGAECVRGGTGQSRSISRRDQLCVQLSARLGVDNVCGDGLTNARRSRAQRNVRGAIASIPADTFARGEPDPIIITQTGLFTRATREVACTVVAEQLYDQVFGDQGREAVVERLVGQVMGLPEGDPRRPGALAIMNEHVDDALESGERERVALQSALVVACMSPGVAGMGF